MASPGVGIALRVGIDRKLPRRAGLPLSPPNPRRRRLRPALHGGSPPSPSSRRPSCRPSPPRGVPPPGSNHALQTVRPRSVAVMCAYRLATCPEVELLRATGRLPSGLWRSYISESCPESGVRLAHPYRDLQALPNASERAKPLRWRHRKEAHHPDRSRRPAASPQPRGAFRDECDTHLCALQTGDGTRRTT